MAARVLTLRELNRATLARQGLLEQWGDTDVPGALARVGGLQAQEPKPPFVGLWTRVAALTVDDVLTALRSAAAVRATLMRGTLHVVAAEDWGLFHGPPEPGDAFLGTRSKGMAVEPVLAAAEELLHAHGPMSFNTLRPMLAERFPGEDDRMMGYAARLYLPLVMTPSDDRWGYPRDPLFGLTDLALPRKRDDAGLMRRYLAAFGPATVEDAQVWSGRTGLRPVVEAMRDELAVFADEHRPLIAPTKNLRIKATILVDGMVAGTWAMKATKTRATVTLEPFARVTKRMATALEAEADAVARFLEPTVTTVNVDLTSP